MTTRLDVRDQLANNAGQRYEDRYGGFLELFQAIAQTEGPIDVHYAPWCWVPLLTHLNCFCPAAQKVFPHCGIVRSAFLAADEFDRTIVEVLSCFRPETVDALWKCDMQWKLHPDRVFEYEPEKEFIITTNGGFHRKELLDFMKVIDDYKPTKKNVVLVPCAADKPYPSPLHKAIMDIMPDDFYIAATSGALGIVPQDLWPQMPWYDAGIPNQWRMYQRLEEYFREHDHDRIIVFCDFSSEVIYEALNRIDPESTREASFVVEIKPYTDYTNLLAPEHMDWLKREFQLG